MNALFPLLAAALLTLASCRSLNSTTYIQPNNRFVLGNNEHGSFTISLRNASSAPITLYQQPLNGAAKELRQVAPGQRARLSVPANTGVIIANNSSDTARVQLRVNGDTGLGMQYSDTNR